MMFLFQYRLLYQRWLNLNVVSHRSPSFLELMGKKLDCTWGYFETQLTVDSFCNYSTLYILHVHFLTTLSDIIRFCKFLTDTLLVTAVSTSIAIKFVCWRVSAYLCLRMLSRLPGRSPGFTVWWSRKEYCSPCSSEICFEIYRWHPHIC